MKREEFAAQCERGAAELRQVPVSSALLKWTAEQLKRGEPAWWKGIAKAWEKRSFVAWNEAWGLYLAAIHFEALSDAECPLVPFFPSCGGTAEADPATGLARFFASPPPSFFENLKSRHRRSYSRPRAELWLWLAILYFQRKRGLPYYVVEVNSGAGLNMAIDVVKKFRDMDSSLVAARIGLDPMPLDLSDLANRRWLTAGIWPEYLQGIAELDSAIELVQRRQGAESSFLQLAACPPEKAPAFVAKNIPSDDSDVGLLVMNAVTTARMTDAEYAAYASAMGATLKPWGDRGLWIEIEPVRGETFSTTVQVRAHRFRNGQPSSAVLAKLETESGVQSFDHAGAAEFLSVA